MAIMRHIDDEDYLACLSTRVYRDHYIRWKARIEPLMDEIAHDLAEMSEESVREKYQLTPRDIVLMVQLGYLTSDEIESLQLGHLRDKVIL